MTNASRPMNDDVGRRNGRRDRRGSVLGPGASSDLVGGQELIVAAAKFRRRGHPDLVGEQPSIRVVDPERVRATPE